MAWLLKLLHQGGVQVNVAPTFIVTISGLNIATLSGFDFVTG